MVGTWNVKPQELRPRCKQVEIECTRDLQGRTILKLKDWFSPQLSKVWKTGIHKGNQCWLGIDFCACFFGQFAGTFESSSYCGLFSSLKVYNQQDSTASKDN